MAKKGGKAAPEGPRQILNRKARFDYLILEEVEAGIVLKGSEVKSIFGGTAHLADAYCHIVRGEMFLANMDVEPYEKSSVTAHDRRRERKLLLHRREIDVLERKVMEKGLTLIPLMVAFNEKGKVKVTVGLGRGKAHHDKRDAIAKRDERREVDRELGRRG